MRLMTNIFRPRLARAKLNSDSLIIFVFVAIASDSQLDAFSGNSIKRHRHSETQESRTNLNMEPVIDIHLYLLGERFEQVCQFPLFPILSGTTLSSQPKTAKL